MSLHEIENVVGSQKSDSSAAVQDIKQWVGNWIWRTVLCLSESPDFEASPEWIADRLNISLEKAQDALDGLERTGRLSRDGEGFKTLPHWHVSDNEISATDLLGSHSKIAPQLLSKLQPTDKFNCHFMRGNAQIVNKYASEFMKLYDRMEKEAIECGITDVVASEISFVVLTHKSTGVN